MCFPELYGLLYAWKFSLDKSFAKPSYLCVVENFRGNNFRQSGKGRHILYAIFNTGQRVSVMKFSPMRAGEESDKNFPLVKIST